MARYHRDGSIELHLPPQETLTEKRNFENISHLSRCFYKGRVCSDSNARFTNAYFAILFLSRVMIFSYRRLPYLTNWLYSPLWSLASCTNSLQSSLYIAMDLQFLTFSILRSCPSYPRPCCRFLN
jgi:hypothetical protein